MGFDSSAFRFGVLWGVPDAPQIGFLEVSAVRIDDGLIQKVADRTARTPEAVREYLAGDQQDDELLKAFLFFGVGPFNKTFQ